LRLVPPGLHDHAVPVRRVRQPRDRGEPTSQYAHPVPFLGGPAGKMGPHPTRPRNHGKCAMSEPRILMCPPDHYGIEYEINPWMNRSLGAVAALAFRQWQQLHDTLAALGVRVETMTPQPGLPDLVFTANAGLVFHRTFLSSRFRH